MATTSRPTDLLEYVQHLLNAPAIGVEVNTAAILDAFGERTYEIGSTFCNLALRAFASRFGRPLTREDPIVWSPYTLEPCLATPAEAMPFLAAVLYECGWPLDQVYAFERTGMVLFDHTDHRSISDEDLDRWFEACDAYQGSR